MNSSVYIFGSLGSGYTQYPDDYAKEIYQNFYLKSTAPSQITIHRDNNLIYYGYIRKLDVGSQYIGFCVLFNGMMFSQIGILFPIFENAVADLVARGNILHFSDRGDVTSSIANLNERQQEVERIVSVIQNHISELGSYTRKLPPVSYGVSCNESKTFSESDRNEDIVNASCMFGYTYVLKDKDYDTASLTSYKSVLIRLNDENNSLRKRNEELKEQNAKILRQKKQFKNVVFLILTVIGCGIGLLFLNNNLNITKSELADANNTINIKNDTIKSKDHQITDLQRDFHNLRIDLNEERLQREQVESDYENFRNSLYNIQPLIIKSTSFNFDNGWLSFDYYGLADTIVNVHIKAYGEGVYSNSSMIAIEKGHQTNSIFLNRGLNSSNWYSFILLVGDKVIGGDRH